MLFVIFALVLAASAQTPPTISDDFTAEVKLDMVNGDKERHVEGKWYFDFTGRRDRFDAEVVGLGRVDVWKIWNSSKTVNEYAYENGQQICHHRSYTETPHGLFDFLPHSKLAGACDGGAKLWSARVTDAFEYDACISSDGLTPHWVERKNLVEAKHHVIARFHTYKAGRPDASNYNLPLSCK